MTGRIARTLVAAAAILLPAAPAASGAGGAGELVKPPKLKEVASGTAAATGSPTGHGSPVSATATCPSKTKVVAGGYTTSVPDMSGSDAHWLNVFESRRVGDNRWGVSGVQYFPAPATDTLVAYAYCQVLGVKVKTVTASVPIPATLHSTAPVLATCPSGTKALSGGFSSPASTATDDSYVSRSTVVGITGWVVDATNLFGTAARTLNSYVYCAKLGKLRLRAEDVAVTGPVNTTRGVASVPCPKPTAARAGGFATSTPVGGLAATALVFETRRLGGKWNSSASASGDTTSSTLVSTAICR